MLTRPAELPDATVIEAVREGWGLDIDRIEYAPVGFGSFHWRVTTNDERWFVTADDLAAKKRHPGEPLDEPRRRLSAALSTARSLRDAGLRFVVAPRLAKSSAVLHRVDDRYVVAIYPYVEGDPHPWGPYPSRKDRLAVLDLIVALHDAPDSVQNGALVDDLVIPDRDLLVAALADRLGPWSSGPFGEPTRVLLDAHADALARALDRCDQLAAAVTRQSDRMVVTHGEPHRGNTITTDDGTMLIDWDTVLIAPPERDLWALADEDPQVIPDYTARTGVTPDRDSLELYRLWWDLTEIAIYTGWFRQPHVDNEDTRLAWDGLHRYLDPDRWQTTL